MSLIDRVWAKTELPDLKVLVIASPLRVRGVRATKYETSNFVTVPIYLPSISSVPNISSGNKVLVYIKREFYLINNLRAKILIGNNIITLEKIVINISNKSV